MAIVNRTPSLPERGKIKIGGKGAKRQKQGGGGEYSLPVKYDHFVITTMERGENDNFIPDTRLMERIAETTGQDPHRLTSIPIRLLYNGPDVNFRTRYAAYGGKKLWCAGDGNEAIRRDNLSAPPVGTKCPCEHLDSDYTGKPKCKISGVLSVLIEGALGVGGVWQFRTGSFNSVDGIMSALRFMYGITGGQLANILLNMVISPKQATTPDGKQQTIQVVGLQFQGLVTELRDEGLRIALDNAKAHLQIEHIEEHARRILDVSDMDEGEEGDVADEFYPDGEEGEGDETPDIKAPGETKIEGCDFHVNGQGTVIGGEPEPPIVMPSIDDLVDDTGIPWNPEIHSASKAKNANGKWRAKRGLAAQPAAPDSPEQNASAGNDQKPAEEQEPEIIPPVSKSPPAIF